MTFGEVVEAVQNGAKAARKGWNGKNMYIVLVPERVDGDNVYAAHVVLRAANGVFSPWNASQADFLATDWELV